MTTMRERAEAAGGRLEITSARGTGTVLRATVPF
jgi:signal transduction histidine kinase